MVNKLTCGIVRVELTHMTYANARVLHKTLGVIRDATSYMLKVIDAEKDNLKGLSSYDRMRFIEMLTHKTKANRNPKYSDFDSLFYKLPSYIRRAVINEAAGYMKAHNTICDKYYEERARLVGHGCHVTKMTPRLNLTPQVCPTFYKDGTLKRFGSCISIKVYVRNTWDWMDVTIPQRDLKSLQRAETHGTLKNPKLVYEFNKFYLEFPVEYAKKDYPADVAIKDQKVLGVDLGLNHGAVCSIVDASGTVCERHFDPFKKDMDRIDHIMGLIRKMAKTSGKGQPLSSLYTKLQGLKNNYARQLARWIVNTAISAGAYGIVLEHLDVKRGRKGKSLAMRVHNWCTAYIRDLIKGMAFREGIRVFIINPKNTSKFAFDGSGVVTRDEHNHTLCTFANGKQYNCDLSASYNIAARYFIRAYKKSMPETAWSQLTAKVPELVKGTEWTLHGLRLLNAALPAAA